MICNIVANHLRAPFAEPWIDRLGRLKGNWLALRDLMLSRIHPGRVLERDGARLTQWARAVMT
jgi:hypothetical protein